MKEEKKRVPIKREVRQFIYERCHNICEYCFCFKVQQIHHINGDASDSRIENLMGVCYDCHVHHLNGHGRKPKQKTFEDYEAQKRLEEVSKNDQLHAVPINSKLCRMDLEKDEQYMDELEIIYHNQWIQNNGSWQGCSICKKQPVVEGRYETNDTNFKPHYVRYCEPCWISRKYYTNHNMIIKTGPALENDK